MQRLLRVGLLQACFILVTIAVYAQPSPSKDAAIRELFSLTGVQEVADSYAEQTLTTMEPILRQTLSHFNDDTFDALIAELKIEMELIDYVEMILPIYDKHFTEAEINGLLDFYRTPIGKKFLKKESLIISEVTRAGELAGEKAAQNAFSRILPQTEQ